jgi:hypothetical protein
VLFIGAFAKPPTKIPRLFLGKLTALLWMFNFLIGKQFLTAVYGPKIVLFADKVLFEADLKKGPAYDAHAAASQNACSFRDGQYGM